MDTEADEAQEVRLLVIARLHEFSFHVRDETQTQRIPVGPETPRLEANEDATRDASASEDIVCPREPDETLREPNGLLEALGRVGGAPVRARWST